MAALPGDGMNPWAKVLESVRVATFLNPDDVSAVLLRSSRAVYRAS